MARHFSVKAAPWVETFKQRHDMKSRGTPDSTSCRRWWWISKIFERKSQKTSKNSDKWQCRIFKGYDMSWESNRFTGIFLDCLVDFGKPTEITKEKLTPSPMKITTSKTNLADTNRGATIHGTVSKSSKTRITPFTKKNMKLNDPWQRKGCCFKNKSFFPHKLHLYKNI